MQYNVGVSGIAVYVPSFRVSLENWCRWTGKPWSAIKQSVGSSFRIAGPQESIYTMAATAALRLINRYQIDPSEIGFIGLGTESSTDNSTGAVIVRGMLDDALETLGKPRISRRCEVPEFKHACLGGIYALKAALRFAATDGKGRKAIVVASDIAEYERGSTGEQTQGAGAVAMLVENAPSLFSVDLENSASASTYRGVDFRKPNRRMLEQGLPPSLSRLPDYPVFNGKFSTLCYTDQTISALTQLMQNMNIDIRTLFHEVEGAFFHRPFHSLPINLIAALYVWGLTQDEVHLEEFKTLCEEAGVSPENALQETTSTPNLFRGTFTTNINRDMYPLTTRVVKYFKRTDKFKTVLQRKMRYGLDTMMKIGNLYTASLPACIAAGIEEALNQSTDLSEKWFLTIGYGSGDASEAMMIRINDDWKEAALRIKLKDTLENAIDLSQEEYEALHDGFSEPCPEFVPNDQFVIDRIGNSSNGYQDTGIEYYRYCPPRS